MWIARMGSDDKGGLGLKSMPYPMVECKSVSDAINEMVKRLAMLKDTRTVLTVEKIDGEAHD